MCIIKFEVNKSLDGTPVGKVIIMISSKQFNEIDFSIFCIENIAIKLNCNPREVYLKLTDNNNILGSYIIPNYEMLHTQSKDYIVDDVIAVMREEGAII